MFGAAQYGLVEVKGDFITAAQRMGTGNARWVKLHGMTASAPPVLNIILISAQAASRVSRTVMHTQGKMQKADKAAQQEVSGHSGEGKCL